MRQREAVGTKKPSKQSEGEQQQMTQASVWNLLRLYAPGWFRETEAKQRNHRIVSEGSLFKQTQSISPCCKNSLNVANLYLAQK